MYFKLCISLVSSKLYFWIVKSESRAVQWVSMHIQYRHVPFCTLSHSRKISSPPLQLPELRLTLQIFSSAVLGAPVRHKEHLWINKYKSQATRHFRHAKEFGLWLTTHLSCFSLYNLCVFFLCTSKKIIKMHWKPFTMLFLMFLIIEIKTLSLLNFCGMEWVCRLYEPTPLQH